MDRVLGISRISSLVRLHFHLFVPQYCFARREIQRYLLNWLLLSDFRCFTFINSCSSTQILKYTDDSYVLLKMDRRYDRYASHRRWSIRSENCWTIDRKWKSEIRCRLYLVTAAIHQNCLDGTSRNWWVTGTTSQYRFFSRYFLRCIVRNRYLRKEQLEFFVHEINVRL